MNNLQKTMTFTCGKFAFALAALLSTGVARADSGASWTFTLNEGGDNKKGVLASGNWKLNAELKAVNSDILCLCKNAYVEGSGILDLSLPITQGEKTLVLKEVITYAFYNLPNTVSVRRIVLPETIAGIGTYAFNNLSKVDKLLIRSTNVVALTERAFFNINNMKRLDLGLPNVTAAGTANQVLSNGGTKNTLCFDATGYGDIPANMLGGPSFANLVLKTSLGQKLSASAFTSCGNGLKFVCLTGDCPDLSAGATDRIFGPAIEKGNVCFCIPYGNATYDDLRAEAQKHLLSDEELKAFQGRYPGQANPIGWIPKTVVGTYRDQYLCEFNPLVWENSLVITAEGKYAHLFTDARTIYGLDDGEVLMLTAPSCVIDGVKYSVKGGKIERPAATASGWTNETFISTSYTFVQKGEEGARLTWNYDLEPVGYRAPTVVTDYSPYSEKVTATADQEPGEDGFYPTNTTWTLTAYGLKTTIPQSHFVRWVGDVPAGHETDMPLVITPTNGTVSIRAEILHDWVYKAYDANAKTNMITDGVWKLRASADNNNRVTLGVNWQIGSGLLEGPESPSALDLSGAITDASGDVAYSLCNIAISAFQKVDLLSELRIVSQTLESVGVGCFRYCGNLTNVVLKADSLTGFGADTSKRAYTFSDDTNLVQAVIWVPQVKALPSYFMFKCPLTDADFSMWDVSSVEELGQGAFQQMKNAGPMSFPSAKTVGESCFASSSLRDLTLGSNKTLTGIANTAFNWCSGLKTLTLGNSKDLQVSATAFTNMAPTSVTFLGPAPSSEAIDNIIQGVTAPTGAKDCTIYASFKFPGWGKLAATLTADEATAAAAAGINPRGVYRDGSRKAWMIDQESPYDPSGFLMILR